MKKLISLFFILFVSLMAFSEKWYVCTGSFKNLEKAKNHVQLLNENGIAVFITEFMKSSNEKYYRILFPEEFDTKNDALLRRLELLNFSAVKKIGMNDLWCCKSDGNRILEQKSTFIPIKTSEKQTVIVKVNGIEEQRFDITTDDKIIKINVKLDNLNVENVENESEGVK